MNTQFNHSVYILMGLLFALATGPFQVLAQAPAPTPTPVVFQPGCIESPLDDNTLLTNGGFDDGLNLWQPLEGSSLPTLREEQISEEETNRYIQFNDGDTLTQIPGTNTNFTRFRLKFCYVVPAGGEFQIEIGNSFTDVFPQNTAVGSAGLYESRPIPLDLSTGNNARQNQIRIIYSGPTGAPAFIDNLQFVPTTASSDDPDETPTPTVVEETPTPVSGDTPTQTPTLVPGFPTWTPTPKITQESVQLIANPPMLLVSPDDFTGRLSNQKQVQLKLQVIGSNGEPIDIVAKDPDATIRFRVDTKGDAQGVGTLEQRVSTSYDNLSNTQIKLADLGNEVYFFPLKPYDGTVRVIADIEYETDINGSRERIKIRGIAPIVLRTDPSSSMINATGTFDPGQNYRLGRSAGDRGFRPDVRTNLYFKERVSQ